MLLSSAIVSPLFLVTLCWWNIVLYSHVEQKIYHYYTLFETLILNFKKTFCGDLSFCTSSNYGLISILSGIKGNNVLNIKLSLKSLKYHKVNI